jgi:hypothetical protein
MLALLAVILVGSALAASASAEAGPFWHHREVGEKGEGSKIEEKTPETIKGEAKAVTLTSTIAGTGVEISFSDILLRSILFNTPAQGQDISTFTFVTPKLVKPALTGCEVKIGKENIVVLKGHLMWKWDGTRTQLEAVNQRTAGQRVDVGFTPVVPTEQTPFVEELDYRSIGGLTSVTFSPAANCGVLAGTFTLGGSDVAMPNLEPEEFHRTLSMMSYVNSGQPRGLLQHFWGGTRNQGAKLGLTLDREPASMPSQTTAETEKQEIAVFEK